MMTNNVKKSIIALVFAALMVITGGTAFAQTSGEIILSGTVPEILDVTVTSTANASNLDLSVAATDIQVGNVVERSNKKTGYTVTLESTNAAATGGADAYFKSSDTGNTDILTYSITYGGTAVTLTGGTDTVSDASDKTAAGGAANEVRISYDGTTAFMYEDSYSDTLTFTIAAK